MTMATTASILSPLPYPRALYIAGANSGKPNPAMDLRNVTAARAENNGRSRSASCSLKHCVFGDYSPEAAWNVKASMTYV